MPDVISLEVAAGDGELEQRIRETKLDTLPRLRGGGKCSSLATVGRLRAIAAKSVNADESALQSKQLRYVLSRYLQTQLPKETVNTDAAGLWWWHAGAFRRLASDSLTESFEVMVRNGSEDDVLVEVSDAVSAAHRAIARFAPELLDAPAPLEREISLEEASAARRIELARDWPTAVEVSRRMGSTAGNGSQLATRLRREGALLGVYMTGPTHHYRFPIWQFRPDGQPIPQMREILAILRDHGPFLDTDRRTTGWSEVAWFMGGHALLDGQAPLEVLATEPERVVEAARIEFVEDA